MKRACLALIILILSIPTTAFSQSSGNIAQVWANEGGDKVTRDELRANADPNAVINSVWDGESIILFGARNETVAFNLVLEAPNADATGVTVSLTTLDGPDGASISTRPAQPNDDLFNYVGRNIELFYVRYLEIKGISTDLAFAGFNYDERHVPERCRRSYNEEGWSEGTWEDRPCHNKFYPDIAVPLELETPFIIPAGSNQSIWGDIYIPKDTPPGDYSGSITVTEDGAPNRDIPITLTVRSFTLPDLPSARTMLFISQEDVRERYMGEPYPEFDDNPDLYAQWITLTNRHLQFAHRHKVSLIDNGDASTEDMDIYWVDALRGDLFTPERGYEGVGVGVGNNVYSIGTYGGWAWQEGDEQDMWANADTWVNWFDAQAFDTPTDYFLYLIDESEDFAQTEQWAQWMDSNPGPGQRLMSMATVQLPGAIEHIPSLDIVTNGSTFGITDAYQAAADIYTSDPDKRLYIYNGSRPATGSFAIEDEGVALRMIPWVQFKVKADRWFYWESTYYVNYQCYGYTEEGQTNVFQQAQTFGCMEGVEAEYGETGWNYFNGDGVLFYPGTDTKYPEQSYGLMGPFASLRIKLWRRGIQDMDYLSLAAQADPARTAEIVNQMVPKVLWEYGVADPDDPSWVRADISWPIDPDVWEAARAALADIIESAAQ